MVQRTTPQAQRAPKEQHLEVLHHMEALLILEMILLALKATRDLRMVALKALKALKQADCRAVVRKDQTPKAPLDPRAAVPMEAQALRVDQGHRVVALKVLALKVALRVTRALRVIQVLKVREITEVMAEDLPVLKEARVMKAAPGTMVVKMEDLVPNRLSGQPQQFTQRGSLQSLIVHGQ
jgi:hypothetical protein